MGDGLWAEMGARCLAFAEALGMDVWRGLGKGGRDVCVVSAEKFVTCIFVVERVVPWIAAMVPHSRMLFLHHDIARAMFLPRADSFLGFLVTSAACLELLLVVVYTVHYNILSWHPGPPF